MILTLNTFILTLVESHYIPIFLTITFNWDSNMIFFVIIVKYKIISAGRGFLLCALSILSAAQLNHTKVNVLKNCSITLI